MLRKDKDEKLERYRNAVEQMDFAFMVDPTGVGIRVMDELRGKLAESGVSAVMVKNTLARIVFERAGMEKLCDVMLGPSLMVYGAEDVGAAAKILREFRKDFRDKILPVKAVWYENELYPAEDFSKFASLPTKDGARAQLLRALLGVPQRLVLALNDAPGRVVRVLDAYAKKSAEADNS